MLTYGIPPEFRGGVHMKPPYAIGSVPSLSGHAVAYRWRSLPRVRRHRASKPQGSSERVLPWQITMDQLIFASLSHTNYWYKVGMLKAPACIMGSFRRGGECFTVYSRTLRKEFLERGNFEKVSPGCLEASIKPSVSSRRLREAFAWLSQSFVNYEANNLRL